MSVAGRAGILFDVALATSSPVKSPVVTEAVAKMRTYRDSPLKEQAAGSLTSTASVGSPASRKLQLDFEGGTFAAHKAVGDGSATHENTAPLTHRYLPSGMSHEKMGNPALADPVFGNEVHSALHYEAIDNAGLGSADILARVDDLKGQITSLHRWAA